MKSRISFFDRTLFLKNVTRFAPCWGLYAIILLLVQPLILGGTPAYLAREMADYIQVMGFFTPIYALICAELLFGDLFNSRMCNALHALPLRRETVFGTNVLSGLAFQFVPTFLIFLIVLVILISTGMPHAWIVAPLWLLALNLQFLFFFSVASLSAFCVGSRFALAVVYGILNFGSVILGWLVDMLFVPMYYGIKINMVPFLLFSPIPYILEGEFLNMERVFAPSTHYDRIPEIIDYIPHLGDTFGYHFVLAAVGIGALALAVWLYRRRNLESAGDFIAIPSLCPVFLVIYTIVVGVFFHMISGGIFGLDSYAGLFAGMAVGWFTGLMLLHRTPRVFSKRHIFRALLFLVLSAAVLLAAAADPFGIESWVPQPSQVESVTIADGHYNYHNTELTLEDPADIQRILEIHQEALDAYWQDEMFPTAAALARPVTKEPDDRDYHLALTFTYRLTNGRTVNRYYNIWLGGDTGEYLLHLFSSPKAVFGREMTPEEFMAQNPTLVLTDAYDGQPVYLYDQKVRLLYEAMLLDCAEGNLSQIWNFYPNNATLFWLNNNDPNSPELHITTACTHTLEYLREIGVDVDHLKDKLGLVDPK